MVGKTMICNKCGEEFAFEKSDTSTLGPELHQLAKLFDNFNRIGVERSTCDDCNKAEWQTPNNPSNGQTWESICPELYRNTDPSRLDPVIISYVNAWSYGPMGLGIVGDSGVGKTRTIFLRLKREHDDKRSIHYRCATEFANNIASLDKKSEEVHDCRKADIFYMDDLDKAKFTERLQTELFEILEYRSNKRKPFIFTANSTSRELGQKFSSTHSKAILRRLTEFCEIKVHEPQYEYAN